jgi:hypothetical protein
MKRRELEKRLRIAACILKREGGSHSLWTNPRTGVLDLCRGILRSKSPWRSKS